MEADVGRLSDSEIRSALQTGANIAVVRVEQVTVEAAGTRGESTQYRLRIEKNLQGQLAGTVEASRYGAPLFRHRQRAIVVLQHSLSWGFELQSAVLLDAAAGDKSVQEHRARIQAALPPDGSALPEAPNVLSCSGRFYYAVSEEVGQEVLFFQRTLKNTGDKEVVFSFYGAEPYVTAIQPLAKIKSRWVRVHSGRPSPPVESDLIRIPAGGEYTHLKWYWADGSFPFHSRKKDERATVYEIPGNTRIRVALCVKLSENRNEFAPFLRPGDAFTRGTLCFEPEEFLYRKLQPQ